VQDLIAAIGILYFERQFISVLFIYAFSYIILYMARELAFSFQSNWYTAIGMAFWNSSSIALALAICACTLRWIAVRSAWKLVIGDKERYDVMWQSMMQVSEYQGKIAEIQNEVVQIPSHCFPPSCIFYVSIDSMHE
jgi:hypothetical protein